jgi:putative FmdB family regulatory protein
MPFYEYTCKACGKEFTLLQPVTGKAEDTVCPYCKEKKTKKKMSKFSLTGGEESGCAKGYSPGGG